MDFLHTWLIGYISPQQLIDRLHGKPAPQWGFYAQALRSMFDSLLLYLPLSLTGARPSTPSYLTFLPTETYYQASIFLSPLFLIGQWLLLSACVHLILCFLHRPSNIDQILNITGMAALIVGSILVVWDWLWIAFGWHDPVLLGISHLIIDVWAIVITVLGFKKILNLPVGLAILLNLAWMVLGIPLSMLFMRAPV